MYGANWTRGTRWPACATNCHKLHLYIGTLAIHPQDPPTPHSAVQTNLVAVLSWEGRIVTQLCKGFPCSLFSTPIVFVVDSAKAVCVTS